MITSAETTAQEAANWQENSSLLYDFLTVYNLEWPALSIQWLPDIDADDRHARFLLGTHAATPSDNYVYILDMEMPEEEIISMEHRRFDKHIDRSGFSYGNSGSRKFKLAMKIHMPFGEIHRARESPIENNPLGAAITADGSVLCFRTDTTSDSPAIAKDLRKQEGWDRIVAKLDGHNVSGWGLAWSPFERNQLVTAADDGTICIWDVNKTPRPSEKMGVGDLKTISPVRKFSEGHSAAPQVVIGSRDHPGMFISGGDDGRILIWDTRVSDNEKAYFPACKSSDDQSVNALSQNPHRPWLLASGGVDHDVSLWDIRTCSTAVAKLSGHQDMVNTVAFCDTTEHFLATGGADRRVNLWDLRDIGAEQCQEAAADGAPELLFSHGGHPATIQDLGWCEKSLMVASVCDANQLQIWAMDRSVFLRESTDAASDDESYRFDTFPVE